MAVELSLVRALLKNNAALLLQYAAGAAVPLLLIPYLARALGLPALGALSITLAWAGYAVVFVQYAFQLTGPAQAAEQPSQLPRVLASVLLARCILLAAAIVALGLLYWSGAVPPLPRAAVLLTLVVLPLSAAIDCTWYLQLRDRFALSASLSIVGSIAAVWAGMQLVTGSDPESISWAALAMVASRFVVGLGSLLASVLISERLEMVPWRDGTTAIAQGRGLFVSQALALAYTGSGPIVIGWLAGLDEVGAYVVIERLFTSVCGALLLLHTAAYPTMARLFHSDRRAYLTLARTVTIVYLCGAGAILCVGWVLRGPVLSYFYGANGARPESLYLLGLLWVTCGILGVMVTGYLVVSGQAQRVYRLTSLVLATSLAAGIPGALMFGAAGWMGGLLIGQLVLAPYALHYWNKEKVMYG